MSLVLIKNCDIQFFFFFSVLLFLVWLLSSTMQQSKGRRKLVGILWFLIRATITFPLTKDKRSKHQLWELFTVANLRYQLS